VSGPARVVLGQERASTLAQLLASQPRPGVEAHDLDEGIHDVVGELGEHPEGAAVVLAIELEEAGVVEVAHALGLAVDRLRCDGRLQVLAPVAGGGGVGQVPRVDLDEDGPSQAQLLLDVLGQGAVGQHLVNVDAEEPVEVAVGRLEVGELVAFPVGAEDEAEHRERLVAALVQQFDEDVGIAIGLQVGAARLVHGVRLIARGVDAPQRHGATRRRRHYRSPSFSRTWLGQLARSSPWALRRASVTRSSPKAMQPVCAGSPSKVSRA
jgi:hypothetical protein